MFTSASFFMELAPFFSNDTDPKMNNHQRPLMKPLFEIAATADHHPTSIASVVIQNTDGDSWICIAATHGRICRVECHPHLSPRQDRCSKNKRRRGFLDTAATTNSPEISPVEHPLPKKLSILFNRPAEAVALRNDTTTDNEMVLLVTTRDGRLWYSYIRLFQHFLSNGEETIDASTIMEGCCPEPRFLGTKRITVFDNLVVTDGNSLAPPQLLFLPNTRPRLHCHKNDGQHDKIEVNDIPGFEEVDGSITSVCCATLNEQPTSRTTGNFLQILFGFDNGCIYDVRISNIKDGTSGSTTASHVNPAKLVTWWSNRQESVVALLPFVSSGLSKVLCVGSLGSFALISNYANVIKKLQKIPPPSNGTSWTSASLVSCENGIEVVTTCSDGTVHRHSFDGDNKLHHSSLESTLPKEIDKIISRSLIASDGTQREYLVFSRRDGTIQCFEMDHDNNTNLHSFWSGQDGQFNRYRHQITTGRLEPIQKVSLLNPMQRKDYQERSDSMRCVEGEKEERELRYLTKKFLCLQAAESSNRIKRVKTERDGWNIINLESPVDNAISSSISINMSLHVCLANTMTGPVSAVPSVEHESKGSNILFGGIAMSSSQLLGATNAGPWEVAWRSDPKAALLSASASTSATFRESRRLVEMQSEKILATNIARDGYARHRLRALNVNAVCLSSKGNGIDPVGVIQVNGKEDWVESSDLP